MIWRTNFKTLSLPQICAEKFSTLIFRKPVQTFGELCYVLSRASFDFWGVAVQTTSTVKQQHFTFTVKQHVRFTTKNQPLPKAYAVIRSFTAKALGTRLIKNVIKNETPESGWKTWSLVFLNYDGRFRIESIISVQAFLFCEYQANLSLSLQGASLENKLCSFYGTIFIRQYV